MFSGRRSDARPGSVRRVGSLRSSRCRSSSLASSWGDCWDLALHEIPNEDLMLMSCRSGTASAARPPLSSLAASAPTVRGVAPNSAG